MLAGSVPGCVGHGAIRSIHPLVTDGVVGALGLVHMPWPALHVDTNLPLQLSSAQYVLKTKETSTS